jgi:hypothetical protein
VVSDWRVHARKGGVELDCGVLSDTSVLSLSPSLGDASAATPATAAGALPREVGDAGGGGVSGEQRPGRRVRRARLRRRRSGDYQIVNCTWSIYLDVQLVFPLCHYATCWLCGGKG